MKDRSIELEGLIEQLLKTPDITIEKIKDEVLRDGFNFEIQCGDDSHATYAAWQSKCDFSVAIVKCTCGHIHLLEDMCIKCHPEWLTRPDSDVSAFSYMYRDLPF